MKKWLNDVDLDNLLIVFLGALFVVLVIVFLLIGILSLGSYLYQQSIMFDCIENGGIWLNNYQIGCTYPHG